MVPLPSLNPGYKEKLDKFLQETASKGDIPAVFFGATNAKETIYFNQAGRVNFGDASSVEVDENTVTEIFSQTKFITCVAAMQMVDKGVVQLDNVEDIEKWLPELCKLPLLKGYEDDTPILVHPQNKITLRMLMSHTAGFVYSHAESFLSKWVQQKAIPSIFDPKASIESLCTPLMYEPGTSWAYSHSIDWVGILVERISGLSLEDYFRKHIFEPCAINSMTFYPTEAIKAHKMAVCTRDADGKVQVIPGGYGMGRPTDPAQVSLLLGGAGLFGTQKDYLSLLRMILQCDPNSPHRSDKPLISGKSFNELFKPSILSDAGCERLSEMVTRPDYITPKPTPQTINHSIAFLLTQADLTARRKANSGCWSGAAKTQFWIDPTTGIAAICGTQLLSTAPDPWFSIYVAFEKQLYAGLQ